MKFFILLILLACATEPKIPETTEMNQFITNWKSDYGPFLESNAVRFEAYLKYMHEFYSTHQVDKKFHYYLQSMNNNFQLIAHLESNLPSRFKKHYGHWPVRKSANYLRYEADQARDLRTRLENQRDQKLAEDLGSELFQKLKEHGQKFDRQGQDFKINI